MNEAAGRVSVASLRREEMTWLAKKCRRKQGLRRRVPSAERKWSLSVSNQFCSVGNSRISHSFVRNAILRKTSGSSAPDNPPRPARQGQQFFSGYAEHFAIGCSTTAIVPRHPSKSILSRLLRCTLRVRVGSTADAPVARWRVRFHSNSGYEAPRSLRPLWAKG